MKKSKKQKNKIKKPEEYHSKDEEYNKLTWKYFWRYKFWEVFTLVNIVVVAILLNTFWIQIANFFIEHEKLIQLIFGVIAIIGITGVIGWVWIAINWSIARDKALEEIY